MNVAVFGLGKLGAPLAVLLASKGHHVLGYDVDPRPGRLLEEGISPVPEPGMTERLQSPIGSFSAATDPEDAVRRSSITFVVVPTPSEDTGAFSTRYAASAASAIGRGLRGRSDYHLVVLTSTVMPGATREAFVPALERAAGMPCGLRCGICYNPEFIALGSVIDDMLHPDFVLIGESDDRAGSELEQFYRGFCENEPPVARMSLENAELAKLALNTYVTMKITFANALADLCERLPWGDVDAVSGALGLDARVGRKYLKGGAGYGGPCFPRDAVAFTALGRKLGVPLPLAEATDRANRARLDVIVRKVLEHTAPGQSVGILGLSYKPGTPVIDCSPGIDLAARVASEGRGVVVYDPMAVENARQILRDTVTYAPSADALLRAVDAAVIMTPWPEFRDLPASAVVSSGAPKIVIDCWRILDQASSAGVLEIVPLGRALRSLGAVAR